jgi:hypothetical protein
MPCTRHSLNLVGCIAVDCCVEAVIFFQQTNFFSASTKWLSILKSGLGSKSEDPKHLSDARWGAHVKATRAGVRNYDSIIDALIKTQDVKQENDYTTRETCIIHDNHSGQFLPMSKL